MDPDVLARTFNADIRTSASHQLTILRAPIMSDASPTTECEPETAVRHAPQGKVQRAPNDPVIEMLIVLVAIVLAAA
jgi:hypothetical protein